MRIVTTNLLNRFWKNGVIPIKDALTGKLDKAKAANNLLTTEEGYYMDARQGPVIQGEIDQINGDLSVLKSYANNQWIKITDWYGAVLCYRKYDDTIAAIMLTNPTENPPAQQHIIQLPFDTGLWMHLHSVQHNRAEVSVAGDKLIIDVVLSTIYISFFSLVPLR